MGKATSYSRLSKSGLVVAVLLALVFVFREIERGPCDEVTVAGAPLVVGGGDVSRVGDERGADLALDVVARDGTKTTRVRLWKDSTLQIVTPAGTRHDVVRVVPPFYLYSAIAAFLIVAIIIPYALQPNSTTPGTFGPWYQLLSETSGGYSLARVQLLLWFLPVAVLYGAFSFVTRSFMPIGTQLGIIFGLSGATTLLGTAASPADHGQPADTSPTLSDLVTDWKGHGDVSRYQNLLLSAFGAIVLVVSFLSKLEFPEIPTQFLYLVATSQGTYLATKAVKQSKADDPAVPPAPTAPEASLVKHAPAQITPTGPTAPPNTLEAPTGMGTLEGSFTQPAGGG